MKFFIVLFFCSNLSFSQVILDSIHISTSFYGPFNKTEMELYLLNNTSRDSIEGVLSFSLNKGSFITDLYLEINNELKSDEMFSDITGNRIYNEIVGRKIDPAILYGIEDNKYILKVFPFKGNEKRKVVINYYSILEYIKDDSVRWFLNLGKIFVRSKTFSAYFVQPQETAIFFKSINPLKKSERLFINNTFSQSIFSSSVENYFITFSYKNNYTYYDKKINTSELVKKNKIKTYYLDIYNNEIPNILFQIIEDVKKDYKVNIFQNNDDPFISKIINYLKSNYEINYSKVDGEYNFSFYDEWFNNFYSYNDFYNTKPSNKIYCPHLSEFSNFITTIKNPANNNSNYLIPGKSKLVLENDERALSIRDKELQYEKKFIEKPTYFTAVEKMPEIVGGIDTLYKLLKCINLKDYIISNHKIYTLLEINSKGSVIKAETMKSNSEILSKICKFITSIVRWEPGSQRGRNISVQVSVPLTFYKDSLENKYLQKFFELSQKKFFINIEKVLCKLYESGFNETSSKEINLFSDEFFILLIENPELVIPFYKAFYLSSFDEVGIIEDTNHYRIKAY